MYFLQKSIRAFTLVELLVTVSILTVLMSVVAFNYGGFNDKLALSSAGQEIGIAIRQAQTYGLNVREVTAGGGQFNSAYGIFFDPTNSSTNKDYYIFADTNGNKKYDVGSGCGSVSTECIEKNTIRGGVRVSSVCNPNCPPSPNSIRTAHITFFRPNPDATINFADAGGTLVSTNQLTGRIILTSLKGRTLNIYIESTGQIYVQ